MPVEGIPSVSDVPCLAPADYKLLKPVEPGRSDGRGNTLTVGSGVPYRDHPTSPRSEGSDACAACQSTETLCIFADVFDDLVGKSCRYELVCRSCGKYSQYKFWR